MTLIKEEILMIEKTLFLFCIGDIAFAWSLKKQSIVTLSALEAEYIVVVACVCHVIWLRK